jgi:hypothetical protein
MFISGEICFHILKDLFRSMVTVTFQNIFSVEIYQNNFFKKKLFLKSAHQNDKNHIKILFINKKNKLNFLKIQIQQYFQTLTIRLVIGIAGPY